jgi:F0F1-type ATP synthase membrane subunit b/b'
MRRLAVALAILLALCVSSVSFAQPPEKHEGKPAAHAEHGDQEHELGPINWFDFSNSKQPPWGTYAINLALLLAGYWYFGKDAIKKGLAARRGRIKHEIDDAQRMLKEAESRAKKYQKKLQELDGDVDQAKKALLDAGTSERDRIVREAKEKASRMEREAHFLVEQELKQIHQEVVRETLDSTVAAAEELLRRSIGPAYQERLAEEYLTQLSALRQLDTARGEVRS